MASFLFWAFSHETFPTLSKKDNSAKLHLDQINLKNFVNRDKATINFW